MLVAMGCNHALLVKLSDRLHDMRTLGALPAAKRNRLAQETIDVWAPLANRLGVWSLKAQLEDLAFKQLYPGEVGVGVVASSQRHKTKDPICDCYQLSHMLRTR